MTATGRRIAIGQQKPSDKADDHIAKKQGRFVWLAQIGKSLFRLFFALVLAITVVIGTIGLRESGMCEDVLQ